MFIAFRTAAILLALFTLAQTTPVGAAPRAQCHTKAIGHLQRLSPHGYAIYAAMTDKKQFLTWVTCDDVQVGLATGVHESVHMLTHERDAFPLIDGGEIRRPHEVSRFFAPGTIASKFDRNDSYVQTYLRPGAASSNEDFLYLLDELNAYSHDLSSAVQLVSLQRRDRLVDHRDGLSALMMFVMAYVETAKAKHPATWEGLQRPGPKKVLQTLWAQAEKSLASSRGIPDFGMKDRQYARFMCERKNSAALAELLGRAPLCPSDDASPEVTSSTPAR